MIPRLTPRRARGRGWRDAPTVADHPLRDAVQVSFMLVPQPLPVG